MGYFPNGSAGDNYYALYCSRCVHEDQASCPVWSLHMLYNYDAVGKDADQTKKTVLEMLIPTDDDGRNMECSMFVPKSEEVKREAQGQLRMAGT